MDRRGLLQGSALLGLGAALARAAPPAAAQGGDAALAALTPPGNRRGRYVEVNGARIFFQVVGSGEPMLLVHGYPLSGALFVRVRDRLARRYRVITPDLRGYGNSTTPDVPDSIATYARDMLDLLTRLGVDRARIGGMSMGGPIVLEMYRRAPQRFSGLVLIDTVAAAPPPAEAGMWRGVAEQARDGVDAVIPTVLHFMLSGETRLSRPAENRYLRAVMRQASTRAAIGGALALARRPDFTALLPRVRVPTLILVGSEDDVYPIEIASQLKQAIPGSRLTVIPGAAHAAIFEAPERCAAAILASAG